MLLTRASAVGDRYVLTAEAELLELDKVVDGLDVLEEERLTGSVQLVAESRVLAVDAAGGITKAEYVVRTFAGRIRDKTVAELPAGTVLVAETTPRGVTRIRKRGGAELLPEHSSLLAQVLETAHPGQATDQQLFGSTEPRRIGESWPPAAQTIADAFARQGILFPPTSVAGSTRLVGQRSAGGVDAYEVAGSLTVTPIQIAGADPKVFAGGKLTIEFDGLYPVDPRLQPLQGKISSRLEVRMVVFPATNATEYDTLSLRTNESRKSFRLEPLPVAP